MYEKVYAIIAKWEEQHTTEINEANATRDSHEEIDKRAAASQLRCCIDELIAIALTAEEKKIWVASLEVGDMVNDCKGRDIKIAEIDGEDYDCQIVLKDGSLCSPMYCCSPVIKQ